MEGEAVTSPNEISFVKKLDIELRLHGKGLLDYTS